MKTIVRPLVVAASAALPVVAWCQDASNVVTGDPWYHFLQALLYLLVVIGLILLTWYVLKRVSLPGRSAPEEGPVDVIQTVSLGQGRTLYLVMVGQRIFLVAWSQETPTLIGEIERSAVEIPAGDDRTSPPPQPGEGHHDPL
ncbi:MAG: flagellar biosynthetic protein FliO [Armatimonadota bacterium]